MNNNISARTHDHVFHADEVSATALLLAYATNGWWENPTPWGGGKADITVDESTVTFQYDDDKLSVLRTRDESICEEFRRNHKTQGEIHPYIVFDVGGKYIVESDVLRLDHHQADFNLTQEVDDHEVGVSSFGLVWKHLGGDILRAVCSDEVLRLSVSMAVREEVRQRLVAFVDGVDTGTWPFVGRAFTYSNVITHMNAEDPDNSLESNRAFAKAVLIAYDLIISVIKKAREKSATEELLLSKLEAQPTDDKILVLDKYLAWQPVLPEVDTSEKILFVVYPGSGGTWMVQTVPVKAGSFESRRLLPESWAGLSDERLEEAAGVPDAVFCHKGRFIGGARSADGAVKLAELALQ